MGKAARLNRERLIAKGVDLNQPYKSTFTVEEVLVECRRQHGLGLLLVNGYSGSIAYLEMTEFAKDRFKSRGMNCDLTFNHVFITDTRSVRGVFEFPIDKDERTQKHHDLASISIIAAFAGWKSNIELCVNDIVSFPTEGKTYLPWLDFALNACLKP
jgi:hypothetical protein